jgi:putative transposase
MRLKPYPSDPADARWAVIQPHLPPARTCRRPHKTDLREMVNAIFYRNRNGCAWRALLCDFPPWRTVYNDFITWATDGTWRM